MALQETARALAPAQAVQVAAGTRTRVADLIAAPLKPAADEVFTGELVLLLEALGSSAQITGPATRPCWGYSPPRACGQPIAPDPAPRAACTVHTVSAGLAVPPRLPPFETHDHGAGVRHSPVLLVELLQAERNLQVMMLVAKVAYSSLSAAEQAADLGAAAKVRFHFGATPRSPGTAGAGGRRRGRCWRLSHPGARGTRPIGRCERPNSGADGDGPTLLLPGARR